MHPLLCVLRAASREVFRIEKAVLLSLREGGLPQMSLEAMASLLFI